MQISVNLYHSPQTDSILIGPEIGSADTSVGKLHVVASGATVRFHIDGREGHVDFNLNEIAVAALKMICGDAG